MDSKKRISTIISYLSMIPGGVKIGEILICLIEIRNPAIFEFLKSGTHGKLSFHYGGKDKPVRVELNTTEIPN
jgi:hypothetical protein